MPSDTSDNLTPDEQPTIPTPVTPVTPVTPAPAMDELPTRPTPAVTHPLQTSPSPQTPAAPLLPPTPTPAAQAPHTSQAFPAMKTPTQRHSHIRALILVALVVVAVVPLLLAGGSWLRANMTHSGQTNQHGGTGGAFPWSNSTRTTTPTAQYAVFAQQNNPVDPAFQSYYTRVNGAVLLGPALTPAYPTHLGWLQMFANGALVAPTPAMQTTQTTQPTTQATPGATVAPTATATATTAATATPASDDGFDANLLNAGQLDVTTGVVRLPLLDVLLTSGSKIPVGSADSDITYVTLRAATAPARLAHQSVGASAQAGATITTSGGVFVVESVSKGVATGHIVPLSIWNYITSGKIAQGNWQEFFGSPLTEALTTTATVNGASHHLLVQAFTLASVAVDLDADESDDTKLGMTLPLGRDYLETLGPPTVDLTAGTSGWLTGGATIANTPGGSDASAHLGLNFPLALSGQTQWINGALWYEAGWQSPHWNGSGWAPASMVTIKAPASDAPAWASFDALSPDVASYLASFGNNVGSVVYDLTRNRYYTYNQNTPFVLGSSSKVSIMCSYLLWLESQGREPNASEDATLTNMIEHSDNNAAQLLFDRLGGNAGQAAFYQKIGVAGYAPDPNGWGWGALPPIGQVKVLTLLQEGKLLTAKDRAYALNLMTHIEPDQHMGVGETLPPGATVAMKDGWVPAPDGLWAINTSGIVTAGSETYIIVVYTAHQPDYDDAWNITRHVCKAVGQAIV
ncbi:MAG TPA: serine hydrolase [Ktedonobacterales bacterium]|nr:serine hydrolase [Ktedonobacterales bacterium]